MNFTNIPLGNTTESIKEVIIQPHQGKLRCIEREQLYNTVHGGVSLPTRKWMVHVELEDDDEWEPTQTFTTMLPDQYVGTTHQR